MNVQQIYTIVNTVTSEVLGGTAVVNEDLSNIIDVGEQVFGANAVDRYVRSLVNHIGKVVFVNRPYAGSAPSVLMDGWEFGSVLEKITVELPEASENESWELVDGQSYDPNVFYKPTVSAKFYNSKTTFEVDMSFTTMQVKQSFSSPVQLNSFMSMIETAIDKSITVKLDALIMRTINNMIALTYENGPNTTRCVNLLTKYNAAFEESLTAAEAVTNPKFIRYAAFQMKLYTDRLRKISKLFNIGGKDRFTPTDKLHFVALSEFMNAADIYLQSDVYHDEFTKMPKAETVPFWQGSGTDFSFASTGKIDVVSTSGASTTVTGILGVMFDRDALGVCNQDRRVTSNYNAKAEFINNFYKQDASYFNDTNENFVVFYAA